MAASLTQGIARTGCAPGEIVARAARDVVDRERGRLPDLSHAVVLLPDLHAAGDVARALRSAAGVPALLLPRIATLQSWAAEVPLERRVTPAAARETLLYSELNRRDWLRSADLWAVSAELAGLFSELTRHSVALPADPAEFSRQLERAYRARSGRSLTFEARLVHELWHALADAGAEVDEATALQLRLSRLAEAAAGPLYALGLGRLAPDEARFLERYGERAPVHVYECDEEQGSAAARTLARAWPREPDGAGLIERARGLAAELPASALAGRLRIVGAANAEQEAQAVDLTVREWLLAGRERIAIVVQDRLVARRARALLERARVLVKDESGWALSTTSAAAVLARWLDVVSSDAYHRDLFDLLKSPFVFHDWGAPARQEAVWRLERRVRARSVVADIGNFLRLAEDEGDGEARQMLFRVQRGMGAFGRRRRSLSRWLRALSDSLGEIGALEALAADSAGAELLERLRALEDSLAGSRLEVDFAEWRRWLSRQLEAAYFRDRAIESPVVFTHLAAARLRRFDACLVVGCDAAHLPGPDPHALFFNQGVRAELGLPTWAERVREMESRLATLIASCESVVATWQSQVEGEPNLLSPFLERLDAVHRLAYGHSLREPADAARFAAAAVRPAVETGPPVPPTRPPAPSIPPELLPRRISASGYNSLLACPYQYYARYALGLVEPDEVQEQIEKRDYGTRLHEVLTVFHRAHPRVTALDPEHARQALVELSERAFAPDIARDYFARAWLAEWQALIPAYLDWQRRREEAGWRFSAGEARCSVEIPTPSGRPLELYGRIDRIDVREQTPAASRPSEPGSAADAAGTPSPITHHPSREFAVIDYKTTGRNALRKAIEIPGEDVQLPVYALLCQGPVTEAMFLTFNRREGAGEVPAPAINDLTDRIRKRLVELFDAMARGAALPANAAEAACEYCEMRGLCRRNYWP